MSLEEPVELRQQLDDEVESARARIMACQKDLELMAQQFSVVQAVLAEARDSLEMASRELDSVVTKI